MVYDARQGIKAKQVFMSFTDAARNSSDAPALTDTKFTGNKFSNFWGAYYGDLVLNSVNMYISDLGFDSTSCSQTFGTQPYDTLSGTPGTTLTCTTNTSMVSNAHAGKYIIIRKANGDKVFARILSNTASVLTIDRTVAPYGVAAGDKIGLLLVPFGLTMGTWARLDHIATDFTLEPPKTETEDVFFLGTSDAAGSQNVATDTQPPSKLKGSITVRGGTIDLLRLKYNTEGTVPSNTVRYNLGSDSTEKIGFTALWATDVGDLADTNETYTAVFCNDISINNVGLLDSVSADGKATATVEFEVKGSNVRVEKLTAQADNTGANI